MVFIPLILVAAATLPGPKVVVPPLAIQGEVDAGTAAIVGELILTELQNGQGISALGPDDVSRIMDVEAQQQILGCSDDGCLAELAGAMNADFVLAGQIGRLGALYVLALKVIDPGEARVVARVTKTLKSVEAIATALPVLLGGLGAKMRAARPLASAAPDPGGDKPAVTGAARRVDPIEVLARARRAGSRIVERAMKAAKENERKDFEATAHPDAFHQTPLPLFYFTQLRKIMKDRGGFDLCPGGTFEGDGTAQQDRFDDEGHLLLCMRVRRDKKIEAGHVRLAKARVGWRIYDWRLP